jgi:hypothetical protein
MPIEESEAREPSGFKGACMPAPSDPQAAYKSSEPLTRASSTTGTRERDIYPEQAAGMVPRKQGNIG